MRPEERNMTTKEQSYRMQDKRERNYRLLIYRDKHREMTYRAIGKVFHISPAMVHRIVKRGY